MTLAKTSARLFLEKLNDYNPVYREAALIKRWNVVPLLCPSGRRGAIWTTSLLGSSARKMQQVREAFLGIQGSSAVRSKAPLGWLAPYPETTGYLIPTMLRYAETASDQESAERALRMAEWELTIQRKDGGFQGGTVGAEPVASSTFVTGQVLFGLVSIYRRFEDTRFLKAANSAGCFLLNCLDGSGRFVRVTRSSLHRDQSLRGQNWVGHGGVRAAHRRGQVSGRRLQDG